MVSIYIYLKLLKKHIFKEETDNIWGRGQRFGGVDMGRVGENSVLRPDLIGPFFWGRLGGERGKRQRLFFWKKGRGLCRKGAGLIWEENADPMGSYSKARNNLGIFRKK